MSEQSHDASDAALIEVAIVVHARTQADLLTLERTQLSVELQEGETPASVDLDLRVPPSLEARPVELSAFTPVERVVIDNDSPLSIPSRPGWRVERRPVNNMGAARDFALRSSSTALLAFVDADVELPPNWLRSLQQALRANPEIWGVASANRPPTDETGFHASLALLLGSWLGHLGSSQAWRPRWATKVRHLSTSAAIFRRDRLLSVGGFNAKFSRVAEDLELGVRAAKTGAQFLLLPGPVVVHRQTPQWRSWSARMFRYGWGQIEVWRVHPREIFSRKLIPLIAAWLGVALIALSFKQSSPWPLCYAMLIHATLLAASLPRVWTPVGLRALLLGLITHISYAAGMWLGQWGLVRNRPRNQNSGRDAGRNDAAESTDRGRKV